MTQGTEVPAPTHVTKVDVRAEKAVAPVQRHGTILHVNMIDAVDEVLQEEVGRDALPLKVARVEVQPELGPVLELLEQALCGVVVEGYLGGMHLEAVLDAILAEDLQDGAPQVVYLLESALYHLLCGLREGVHVLPDGRTHEARHAIGAQLGGSNGCRLHRPDGPSPDAIGVVGQFGRGEVVQARVVVVAYALARYMRAKRFHHKAVSLENGLYLLHIGIVLGCPNGVQMVAPSGEFDAVVAHLGGLTAQSVQVHVCPLTAHECD